MNMKEMASTAIDFDLHSGLSQSRETLKRFLSKMAGMYADESAYRALLSQEDVLVYEFYDMGLPASENEVAYGTSVVYPGKVGNEYFMTKGHFHSVLDAAEIYYCLRGHGYLLLENPEGDWEAREMTPGQAVYVPGRYAHRSINVSPDEPFVFFFAFPAHAGHDYGTIESRGFRKLLVERNGEPTLVDNPRWGSA